ncbi:class E sortase [Streptomyces sp. NPDC047315]|uniref:class E sortase n=1 Tax=Streptomyces sp. NPDC047315 TaxID=3155142 RepID=UPI0033DD74C1
MGGPRAGGGQGRGVTVREPVPGEGASPWFTERAPGPAEQGAGPGDPVPEPPPYGSVPKRPSYGSAPEPPPYDSGRTQDGYAPPPRAARHARPAAPPAAAAGGGDTHVMPVFDGSDPSPSPDDEPGASTVAPPVPGEGRAARRKAAAAAAKGRGGRRKPAPTAAPASTAADGAPARPLTRVEARRAARAAKDSPAVIASRAMGELFITCGVLMLLFVTYQLWWTNVRAGMEVSKEKDRIAQSFKEKDEDRTPGVFKPGEGFAIMYIPKLDVVVPVAETIDKEKVLDRGMVGHYAEGKLKTAMPSDTTGNFAVAGHRNTHGEPFRYINRLKPGDPIVVETRDAYYTYEMASILPQTAPSNIDVLDPVPRGSGFTGPGRYLTMTTCTPEFTSTYRMIVWGKMVEERPRSKGKPDALVG